MIRFPASGSMSHVGFITNSDQHSWGQSEHYTAPPCGQISSKPLFPTDMLRSLSLFPTLLPPPPPPLSLPLSHFRNKKGANLRHRAQRHQQKEMARISAPGARRNPLGLDGLTEQAIAHTRTLARDSQHLDYLLRRLKCEHSYRAA